MLLSVQNLVIKDHATNLILVNDLTFHVKTGDKIAIIGSEGSGKSTLLKCLFGIEPSYVEVQGQIKRIGHMSYLEQNISYQWYDFSVARYLFNDRYDDYDQAVKYLQQLGLSYQTILDRKIGTFSGGEKIKIGLTKALMSQPKVLLLDEPTNDIDFETISFLESFLESLDIPVIFISHDQVLLSRIATSIIHLRHIHKRQISQTTFMRIDYQSYKTTILKQFESQLMIAKKQRSSYAKKIEKFRRIYQKVEYQQNQAVRDPGLSKRLKVKIRSLKAQNARFEKEKESWLDVPERDEPLQVFFEDASFNSNKQLVQLDIKKFKIHQSHVIDEIKLSIKGNNKIVIYGKNGVGKTTLIKNIYQHALENHIKVGYVPQDYKEAFDSSETVLNYLLSNQSKHDITRLRQILGTLGFRKNEMDLKLHQISEGMKLKILLLGLIANEYELLILDEPTRNISPLNLDEIYELFDQYQGAIIAISHDRSFIEYVFDDMYELTQKGLFRLN